VPDYTPITRGRLITETPYSRFPAKIPAPAFAFSTPKLPLPPSLMAPRYSHLMEEAQTIANTDKPLSLMDSGSSLPLDSETVDDGEPLSEDLSPLDKAEQESEEIQMHDASPSIGTRFKGFLFSYLPGSSKSQSLTTAKSSNKSGLPLPPSDILDKARGPITTPAREPMPKPPPHKDLVSLHHTTPKPTLIPRVARHPPRRLVDLRPVSPPPDTEPRRPAARPRRSSGSSVKDLVQTFEHMEQQLAQKESTHASRSADDLRRIRSIDDVKRAFEQPQERPTWRP
jgi:hypothetical protein